jgi:hypothetical protein
MDPGTNCFARAERPAPIRHFWRCAAAAMVAVLCLVSSPPGKPDELASNAGKSVVVNGISVRLGVMADTPDIVAWKILERDRGTRTWAELRDSARAELQRQGGFDYKFRRVEVTGISSADDTEEVNPNVFNKQIKFSHFNEVTAGSWWDRFWQGARKFAKDLGETKENLNVTATPHTKQMFEVIRGAKVEEIVAHSAGAEAIYIAILDGLVPPPRRLIVIGVPDEDKTKWAMLQSHTGIELHVIGFAADNMRRNAEFFKRIGNALSNEPLPERLETAWENACTSGKVKCTSESSWDRLHYDINANPPAKDDNLIPQSWGMAAHPIGDHDRRLYYEYLYKIRLLTKSLDELEQADREMIEKRSREILEQAKETGRQYIDAAARQSSGPANKGSGCVGPYGLPCVPVVDDKLRVSPMPILVPVPAPGPAPVPARPPFQPYNELYLLAQWACRDPDQLTDAAMRQRLSGFPDGQTYAFVSNWQIPAGCLKDLFAELMNFNATWTADRTLDRDWLVREAKRLNQLHAPPPPVIDNERPRPRPGGGGCLPADPNTGIIGCPSN